LPINENVQTLELQNEENLEKEEIPNTLE